MADTTARRAPSCLRASHSFPQDTLHYITPRPLRPNGGGGRLMIPESWELHVGPSACGRRMNISNRRERVRVRRAHLYITEEDIVSGCYEDLIPDAVEELLASLEERPRAVIIIVTCIDDLLATDHEALLAALRARFPDVRFCLRRVDPLCIDGGLPPVVNLTLGYLGLLDWTGGEEAVNLIGDVGEVMPGTELFDICRDMGLAVRQIPACRTFDDFLAMGRSRLNLCVSPIGHEAAAAMEREHGEPYLYCPDSYSLDDITAAYRALAEATGRPAPDLTAYIGAAREEIARTLREVGDMPIVVDGSADVRPASVARALLGYGFNVRLVLSGLLFDGDRSDIDYLEKNRPDVAVADNQSFDLGAWRGELGECMCIGFSSGYLLGAAHLVDFPDMEEDYGFHSLHVLLKKMREARRSRADYGEVMRESEAWNK